MIEIPDINVSGARSADLASDRLIVAMATSGRGEIAARTARRLARQTRVPDLFVMCISTPEDIDTAAMAGLPFPVEVMSAPRGATRQRNRVLSVLRPGDVMVFLDDDFLMASDYLHRTRAIFARQRDVAMVTGTVLADGVAGPGFDYDEGARLLRERDTGRRVAGLREVYNAYGCNMAFRADPVIAHGLRFDERLPLYSWLEDVDFSRQLAAHGRIVMAGDLLGVHLGVKHGRTSGVRLGYSQIANPLYLTRKGTMRGRRAFSNIWHNFASNLVNSIRPEPWIDRRGRLRGNFLALGDLLLARLRPEHIVRL